MKTVKLDREVADVSGLFYELIQAEFELLSISVHAKCTYINLEDEEDKDPLPIAERFLEKPAKPVSMSAIAERREFYEKYLAEKPLRMQNLKARFRVSQEVKAIAQEAAFSKSPDDYQAVPLLEEKPVEVLTITPNKKSWFQRFKDAL